MTTKTSVQDWMGVEVRAVQRPRVDRDRGPSHVQTRFAGTWNDLVDDTWDYLAGFTWNDLAGG